MEKYLILLANAFRKHRLQLLSFAATILISALFLNMGLTIAINFDDIYRQKWMANNMPDVFFIVYDTDYSQGAVEEVDSYPEVAFTETRDCSYLYGEFSVGDDVQVSMPMAVYNREDDHTLNNYTLIDSMASDADNAAYVSYWFYTDKGCQLGDTLYYHTAARTYEFTISGFVEDMQYGNNNCGGVAIHLSQACYDDFVKIAELGVAAKAIDIRTTAFENGEHVYQKALQRLSGDWKFSYQYNGGYYEWNKGARTLMVNITAYIIVAFALAITVVSLLVCGFRIGNGIQEDMRNMGVQKSIGYQSGQVRLAVALPYLILSVASTAIGIALSFAVIPAFTSLAESLTGLVWEQGADIVSILITSAILFLAVILTVSAATRKVRRYPPVEALQSGISHHNFKHNFVSLDKTPLNISAAIGCKNFFGSLRQNVVLAFIVATMTFLAMFAASAYYNMAMKTDNFVNVVSEEFSNVYAVTAGQAQTLDARLSGTEGIDRTLYYDTMRVIYNGRIISAYVCNDYSKVRNNLIYEGRNPIHDNEIAIGSKAAEGIRIGDTVSVSFDGLSVDYLVVGFLQSPNKLGLSCEMTVSGFQKLDDSYTPNILNIYLNDNMTAEECVEMLKAEQNDLVISIGNYDKTIETSISTYINMTSALVGIITIVVVIILVLVLLIVISTIMLQRRYDFGVLKAIGYTTKQLIIQTGLGILPAILLGILTGCFTGVLWMNNIWLLAFASMGIQKVSLGVPVIGTVFVGIGLLLLSLLLSVWLCSGLKRISASELVRE